MLARSFISLDIVGETLGISPSQTYALVRTGELRAIKIGGRGQWRVEMRELDKFILRLYEETAVFVADHPYGAEAEAHRLPSVNDIPDQDLHSPEQLD